MGEEWIEEARQFYANGGAAAAGQMVPRGSEVAEPKWEAPIPFSGAAALPTFPVDALPKALADFVRAEAEATQTPADMAAMLSLAALSAALAKRVEAEVKDGYREPVNLFVAVVLPPGERKSQVMRDVLAPIIAWEQEQAERIEAEIRHAVQRRKLAEKRLAAAEDRAAKATERDARHRLELEAQQLADELDEIKIPVAPRIIVDDVTPEALVSVMAEQGGRAGQFTPEGGVFSMLTGRYSTAPNLDPYLKGHSGDAIRVDRKGRAPEHIQSPALSVGVAVQPAVIDSFAEQPMLRGVGLLARFLYALPASRMGARNVDPAPVPTAVRERYERTLAALLALPADRTITLKLSPQALDAYHAFARWLEPQLAEFGDLSPIRDWAAKLAGAVVRISGIVALVSPSDDLPSSERISGEAFARAVEIGRYLVPHALAAFSAMGADPRVEGAKHVLRCIERNGWGEFTFRQLQQALKGSQRFEHAEALVEPLRLLEERHYVRAFEAERKGTVGRKPRPTYLVNPSTRHNPPNPQIGARP